MTGQDDTLRRGFAVLGRAVRHEPRIFAIAVGGSAVYGVMTVGGGLGARPGHRPGGRAGVPHRRDDHRRAGRRPRSRSSAVALLKAAGIVGRRLGRGRHAVPAAGALPARGDQAVPATAAVLAPAAPDRAAAVQRERRRRGHLVPDRAAADGGRRAGDAVRRRRSRWCSPTRCSSLVGFRSSRRSSCSTSSTSGGCRRWRPARSSCGPRSAGWRTSRSTARWWSRRWAASRRRPRGSRSRPNELRDAQVRVGRVRGMFDPVLEALPNLGVLAVLLVGAVPDRVRARIDAGELVQVAYLFTLLAFPVRAIGWVLGELPRVGRRLGPGVPGARGDRWAGVRARSSSGTSTRRRRSTYGGSGSPTTTRRCCTT